MVKTKNIERNFGEKDADKIKCPFLIQFLQVVRLLIFCASNKISGELIRVAVAVSRGVMFEPEVTSSDIDRITNYQ